MDLNIFQLNSRQEWPVGWMDGRTARINNPTAKVGANFTEQECPMNVRVITEQLKAPGHGRNITSFYIKSKWFCCNFV